MSHEARLAPERIDLGRTDDPRDAVHRAVACLAQGGVVGLPTESGYVLAASALQAKAVNRLRWIGRDDQGRSNDLSAFAQLCLRGAEELPDWLPDLAPTALLVLSKCWPGPVEVLAQGDLAAGLAGRLPEATGAAIQDETNGAIRLCCPEHPVVRSILSLLAGPMVISNTDRLDNDNAKGRWTTAEPLASLPGIDLLLDDGPTDSEISPSILRVDAEGWRLEQTGALDERTLNRLASTVVLFVCTGNTCRSPMAEAIFKVLLAKKLGCHPDQLEEQGYVVQSAGLSAMNGAPAASNAVEIVSELGGSLRQHASRRMTSEMVRQADWILAMTRDHLEALLYHVPEAAPKARLLDAEGYDIDDPVGADLATYRQTARIIKEHLQKLVDEIVR